ncbi:MAG: tetratricopeptide repeat protein [Candidatus Omnitrophica bacterium]|nr:tetratricopeptide repeat protein [Candidatus Omnitrophota bacterium]
MNKIVHPIAALVIFTLLAVSITHNIRRLPVQSLDTILAYLASDELFFIENGGRRPCSAYSLRKWGDYFKRVIRLMPAMADAHGMLGFCYAHMRDGDKAAAALRKAIGFNPYFWGFYYNLGAIYLKQGQFTQAREYFEKALATPPELNVIFIGSSKIYTDLVRKSNHNTADLQTRLQQGYKLSLAGIQLCASKIRTDLPLRMF